MTPRISSENAIAEIVGSLVLISIIALAFAILAMVLLSQPAPQKIPAVAISITNQSKIIHISHESGDSILLNETKVLVDGVPQPFTCTDCGDTWSIGKTLTIDYSDHEDLPNKVDIIFSGAGTMQILLSSLYLGTMTPTQTPVIIPTTPIPVTTTTTPPVGAPVANFTGTPTSGTVPLTVTFTDTSTGTPTGWRWTFGDPGAGNTSTLINPSHTYSLPGNYWVTLTVSNAGGSNSLVQASYITVSYAAPVVISIAPASGYNDTSVSITNLTGTGFINGAMVKLNITGRPDVPATGVTVVSSTQITCSFALSGVTAGTRNVVVTNPDGNSGMLANGFTIVQVFPAPTVTSRSNATLYRGWPGYELIGGTNFVSGATSVMNTTTGISIPSTLCDVRSSSQMFCSYDLSAKAVRADYRVAVINPDGRSAIMNPPTSNYVSIVSPAPTLTARSPTTAVRGWPVSITLTGTGFQPGATVNMTRSGVVINAYNIIVVSPTSITCTFDLVGATAATNWAIRVTNTDGQSSGTIAFTVSSAKPAITSISPTSAAHGTTVSITNLAGTAFQPGAIVQLRNTSTIISTGTNVVVVSPTQITCTFVIPAATQPMVYNVVVTNTDGQTRTANNLFTVTT